MIIFNNLIIYNSIKDFILKLIKFEIILIVCIESFNELFVFNFLAISIFFSACLGLKLYISTIDLAKYKFELLGSTF